MLTLGLVYQVRLFTTQSEYADRLAAAVSNPSKYYSFFLNSSVLLPVIVITYCLVTGSFEI